MSSFELFEKAEFFQVSVLGQDQMDISNTFASAAEDRFAGIDCYDDHNGCPVISDSLASFSCRRWNTVPAGDHIILIGEVTDFSSRDGLGLGYFRGGYFSLDMERRASEAQSSAHEAHQPILVGALLEWRGGLLLADGGARSNTDGELRLPEIVVNDDQPTFDAIKAHIQKTFGVEAKIGSVYSVIDDQMNNRSSIFYRVNLEDDIEIDLSPDSGIVHKRLADIDLSRMESPAVINMLERYLNESRTGNHRIYIGTGKRGRTHQLSEES
jgi:hypothetical protein